MEFSNNSRLTKEIEEPQNLIPNLSTISLVDQYCSFRVCLFQFPFNTVDKVMFVNNCAVFTACNRLLQTDQLKM